MVTPARTSRGCNTVVVGLRHSPSTVPTSSARVRRDVTEPGESAMSQHRLRGLAIVVVSLAMTMVAGIATVRGQSGPAVFINEIHYDNVGTDTGEFIEIAGPAGTDLAGWRLVRYNGATPGAA